MTDVATLPTDVAEPADAPALAAWSQRVIAALLDAAILGGATWLVLGSGVAAPSLTPFADVRSNEPDGLVHSPLAWTVSPWVVALVAAMLLLQGWTGATPGKRVAGVAVLRASDLRPVGFVASVLRVLAHLLDAIFFIGYLRPLWHPRRQTFADSIVGTLAVRTRQPPAHPWFARFRHAPSVAGSAVVTVGALALCVLGVGFSLASSSVAQAGEWEVPCTGSASGATAVAVRARSAAYESRWWVTRPTGAPDTDELRVTWTSSDPAAHEPGARIELNLLDAGGALVSVVEYDVSESGRGTEDALPSLDIGEHDLEAAGYGWTVQSRLLVGGEVVGECTVDRENWFLVG